MMNYAMTDEQKAAHRAEMVALYGPQYLVLEAAGGIETLHAMGRSIGEFIDAFGLPYPPPSVDTTKETTS